MLPHDYTPIVTIRTRDKQSFSKKFNILPSSSLRISQHISHLNLDLLPTTSPVRIRCVNELAFVRQHITLVVRIFESLLQAVDIRHCELDMPIELQDI